MVMVGGNVAAEAHRVRLQPLRPTDPAVLGRHRVAGRLGSGGMGVVYLAEGPLGQVAVKLIREELADDAEFRVRFQREVQACFRVNSRRTARLVDFELDSDRPWLATEFVDAPDLHDWVREYGPLPFDDQLVLAAGLAEALESIHDAGLVHRDLKPTNVLWTADGPKVIDFGIAAATDSRPLTAVGGLIGTPGWLSPEQAAGEEVGAAADVFAWGALVAFASSGEPPFGTGPTDAVIQRVRSGAMRIDDGKLAPDLRPLVGATTDRDPDLRPTSGELVARLNGTRPARLTPPSSTPLPPPPSPARAPGTRAVYPPSATPAEPSPVTRAHRPGKRRPAYAAAAAVAVLAVAGTAVALVLHGGRSPADEDAGGQSPSTNSSFSSDGPWRIQINDKIEGEDYGCAVTVTNVDTGEQQSVEDIYSTKIYQVHTTGVFRWETNNPACQVTALPGAGQAVVPFAQQSSTGDTKAFTPSDHVTVEVIDFNGSEECMIVLRDAADGQELDFATARLDAPYLTLKPNGRPSVYLSDLQCGVRVSAE